MAMLSPQIWHRKASQSSQTLKKVLGYLFGVLLALGGLFIFSIKNVAADTLYEYSHLTGNRYEFGLGNDIYYVGQTFGATTTHAINYVRVELWAWFPGLRDIDLYLIDTHSATPFDCGNLWFNSAGDYIEPVCIVASSTLLSIDISGTPAQYDLAFSEPPTVYYYGFPGEEANMIVLGAHGGSIYWNSDDGAGYSGGKAWQWAVGYSDPTPFEDYDMLFENWSYEPPGPPPTEGYYPILTPAWPVNCVFNATDTFSGTATGKLEIPASATGTWTKLQLIFYDIRNQWGAGQNTIASTTFSLTAGQELNYSMPYTLATSSFDVWYAVWGYSSCPGIPYCQNLYWTDICGTGFGVSGAPTIPEIISPPPPFGQEDCSGYDLLEKLTCEIKNFIAGAFLPNASSTLELQRNLDLVKQRAPYNYIVATRDFFASVNSTLTTSTPEISIMGATGTLDFSLMNTTTTFAGASQKISVILRGFFQMVLILGFLFWAQGYLRKIFK